MKTNYPFYFTRTTTTRRTRTETITDKATTTITTKVDRYARVQTTEYRVQK